MTLLLFLLAACNSKADDSSSAVDSADTSADSGADRNSESGSDSGSDSDSGGGDDTEDTKGPPADPVCGVRPGEDWLWNGECPQMGTPCNIAMADCEMTITYPSPMDMGMPHAGVVKGTLVTFEDGPSVTGCTGTIESVDRITGSCAGGCTFELYR